MWNAGARPDRLTTPPVPNAADHFNNNPYSRNSAVSQHSVIPNAQKNNDPWNWGYGDDNGSGSGQGTNSSQDENDLWGPQSIPHHHQQSHIQHQQPQFSTNNAKGSNNSSEYFENIDLKSSIGGNSNLYGQQQLPPPPPPSLTPQPQYHYSHMQPPQHFIHQQVPPPPPPQVSNNSSYSYFQFAESQQTHLMGPTPLGNQYSSTPMSQPHPQPAYNPPTVPNFQQQQPQTQPQFMQTHNYNYSTETPYSQQQFIYNRSNSIKNLNSNNVSSSNNSNIINNNNNNSSSVSAEVENREIAPPEKTEILSSIQTSTASPPLPPPPSSSTSSSISSSVNNSKPNNNIVPENQETVPENEERPPDSDTISSSLNNLRLNSPPASELGGSAPSETQQWNSVSGWENQEVAPRCTVDREQYLETGHLHPPSDEQSKSQGASVVDNDVDVDTNDEGEAAPPPGLHRLVTGQGQRVDQERLVVGSPPPPTSTSGSTSLLHRPQVLGQRTQQHPDLSTHSNHPPLGQRMIPGQLRDDDMERMVLGSSGNSTSDSLSSIQPPRDQMQNNSVSHRTVPGGRSDDMQQSRDRDQPSGDHVSQRTVPGGSSSSSIGSNSSYSQLQDLPSEERLVLGRPTIDQGDDRLQPQQNLAVGGHNIGSSSSSTSLWPSGSVNHDLLTNHQSSFTGDNDITSQQPPRPPSNSNSLVGAEQSRSNSLISDPSGLQRMVLGHPDNSSRGGSASGDDMAQTGVPPLGLHRMVLGEQQEQKQQQLDQLQQLPVQSQQPQPQSLSQGSNDEDGGKDRDIDSDTDYRMNRRKHRHRQDSMDDDNYNGHRDRDRDRHHGPEYWDRRSDDRPRRHYKDRSHHPSYDHSPEYRSEEELDRERTDYREPRDYRPRPRDRDRERGDRRRQSPDYYYREDDYREDPRRQGRGGRYGMYYRNRDMYEDEYYYHENRSSRPSSRSGVDYSRRPGGHRDFGPTRNVHPYYHQDPGKCFRPSRLYRSCSYPTTHPLNHLNNSQYSWYAGGYSLNYYQCYEMLRNDPQAYAAWYSQYMASKYGQGVHHPDDRTSMQGGRNSANHHRSSNEKVLLDESSISVSSNRGMNSSAVSRGVTSVGSTDNQVAKDEDDVGSVSVASQRYTPQLYPGGAHIRGKWSNQGQLVVISPNYPREGQPPIVEVMQFTHSSIQNDPDVLEFLESPGPFIVGVTHKNTVSSYLKKRADLASHNAEKLLYELMQLVVRLNGVVDMIDVADLLMSNYNEDPSAEYDQNHQVQQQQCIDSTNQLDNGSVTLETSSNVTDRFRELLLQGNKLDALEWAMQNKHWGHAFVLASKMDTRSYNNVMLRFTNALPANDPLQTLYQMMSGREPQAAVCCADKKWGDWRPHLAMMLSNPSGNPDLDRKSIITLGDSLANRGRLFASHFCYVTAQVEFGAFTDPNARLVLLGSSHLRPFAQFATCRSIMLTLCYEYAKRLNKKDLTIPALQVYKYLLAVRLIDNGKLSIASQYLEAIALDMIHRPNRQNRQLTMYVAELADQIKMADPALAMINDPNDDPDWLNTLKQILLYTNDNSQQTPSLSRGISTSTVSTSAADPTPLANQMVGGYNQDMQSYYDNGLGTAWNQQPDNQNLDTIQDSGFSSAPKTDNVDHTNWNQYPQQPQLAQIQPEIQVSDVAIDNNTDYNMANSLQQPPQQNFNSVPWDPLNEPQNMNSWQDHHHQQQQMAAPGMPPVTSNSMGTTANVKDSKKKKDDSSSGRTNKKNKEQSSSGWFGGIWDKISFRPKNEMKLPDDKNPLIVWDEKKHQWVNKDADENDETTVLKPPPKATDLPAFMNSNTGASIPSMPPSVTSAITTPTSDNISLPGNMPAASSTPIANVQTANPPQSSTNIFKRQRGKGMKANYIDIMNPNTNKTNTAVTGVPPPLIDPVSTALVNNFFIPAPVEGNENASIDFVSPSGYVSNEPSHKALDQNTELSRCSSASSLSREVSYIMSRNRVQRQSKPIKEHNHRQQSQPHVGGNYSSQEVPTFYNPSSFTLT